MVCTEEDRMMRQVGDELRSNAPAYDNSRFRVCTVWAPNRENFTYHYVAGPRGAANHMALPGPTEGAMAALFQEREADGQWYDWYSDEGMDLEECIEEGAELSA
jgi:hypothetical protein